MGKRQSVAHLRVFGAKCWAKTPTAVGSSKFDPRSTECHFLGYMSGSGNYKVQDLVSRRVFVSCDVVFEEGQPRRTSVSVGEKQIPLSLLDATTDIVPTPPADVGQVPAINNVPAINIPDHTSIDHADHQHDIPIEPRRSV